MAISVKAELARKNTRYKEAAKVVGMSASGFYKKLEKNNLSLEEAEKVFDFLGMELRLEEKPLYPPSDKI